MKLIKITQDAITKKFLVEFYGTNIATQANECYASIGNLTKAQVAETLYGRAKEPLIDSAFVLLCSGNTPAILTIGS